MDLVTILQILFKWDGSESDNFSLANCSHKSSAEVCRGKAIFHDLDQKECWDLFLILHCCLPLKWGNLHNSGGCLPSEVRDVGWKVPFPGCGELALVGKVLLLFVCAT